MARGARGGMVEGASQARRARALAGVPAPRNTRIEEPAVATSETPATYAVRLYAVRSVPEPAASRRGGPRDDLREIVLHGHRVFYRSVGDGPVVVLVHGITSTSATWANVLPYLAERFTIIAPDLLGHGESAKPRGDYSLGAYASGIRDLLAAIGHDRATVVGHSLGGGVAMQMAYQFPERCERLVLVSSGGLGRE